MKNQESLIVALDFPRPEEALEIARSLRGLVGAVKVGFELFVSTGPDLIGQLKAMDHRVFLDLKLHDIPNTVAGAARAATRLGLWMITLHASGGEAMMRAAAQAARDEAAKTGQTAPKLVAVTILTSLDDADLSALGMQGSTGSAATRLARLAKKSEMDGVVCSPHEARRVREICGDDFLRVTPGVRPAGEEKGDQKRTMTPSQALKAGASYIVVGRPITRASDPAQAALLAGGE